MSIDCDIVISCPMVINNLYIIPFLSCRHLAEIAQLGERKTEDLKVSGSIPDFGS